MPDYEHCGEILQNLRNALPSDPTAIPSYLLGWYHRLTGHPCKDEISGEIGRILVSRCPVDEFSRFCHDIRDPEPLLTPILEDLSYHINAGFYDQASVLMAYLLPFGQRTWPDSEVQDYRSFRDLIEYIYYIVVCEPEREVIACPYVQTDTLYQYGRLLAGTRDDKMALTVLKRARHQNPVHAGILGVTIGLLLRINLIEEALPLLTRSFSCAWTREDLALAYRNQGFLCSLQGDDEAAITCYLMAETWEVTSDGREELRLIARKTGKDIETGYYNQEGRSILISRGIPVGPDPVLISLLEEIAGNYLEEGNILKAREYLIRAHLLVMSDELEEKIRRTEQFLEDQIDF